MNETQLLKPPQWQNEAQQYNFYLRKTVYVNENTVSVVVAAKNSTSLPKEPKVTDEQLNKYIDAAYKAQEMKKRRLHKNFKNCASN